MSASTCLRSLKLTTVTGSVWLQEHQLSAAAAMPNDGLSDVEKEEEAKPDFIEKQMSFEKVTRLSLGVYSCYLRSLATVNSKKKDLPNLYLILRACYGEKNGDLAGRAIDTISKCFPVAVIPLGCYELAIRANLRDLKRGERELLTAIRLARALLNDGGYILNSDIWSGLVKSNFCQVLRTASRFTGSIALEMMRFCWVIHDANYPNRKMLLDERKAYNDTICLNNLERLSLGDTVLAPNVPAVNKEAETEMLNTMLWELLKHRHAVPSVVQVLDMMEATRSIGGGGALRKAVVSMFEYDMNEKKMSPRTAVKSSLKFWGERSTVLHDQGFLVHLLLEECVEHQLDDECKFLVDYLLDLGVGRVPMNSIVKLMGANELRGRFEANARIGNKVLQKLSHSNRGKLRDDFYERYLMSYLRLEQFDKVIQLSASFKLKQRYPHNEVIRTIVQDAAAQVDKLESEY
ncbi:unnamed protein product [Peronospora destructor]|uniref:Uncharacterized protein n=1 Tax=Peronospora destructor TaxID=86335 RepID=A0AAV0TMW5_9STRA|nr:unnamed protein product [Peronospora destructor]